MFIFGLLCKIYYTWSCLSKFGVTILICLGCAFNERFVVGFVLTSTWTEPPDHTRMYPAVCLTAKLQSIRGLTQSIHDCVRCYSRSSP
jgi:hypothetical protein